MTRPIRAAIAASLAALALAACGGKVIDDGKAEDAIKQDLGKQGVTATSVDCPGDVDVSTGDTFDCNLETNEGKATLTLKILDEDGRVKPIDVKATK